MGVSGHAGDGNLDPACALKDEEQQFKLNGAFEIT
jgi:hypothetical protein